MESFKTKIKKYLYNSIPTNFKKFIEQEIYSTHKFYKYLNQSFSQEGEDQILAQLFYGIEEGFFLDIGAHQPIKYSNTYKFYLKGWKGINIDAMPGSMEEFNEIRPNDINLEYGVSNTNETLKYYIFTQGGVNTFSSDFATQMIEKGCKFEQAIEVKTEKMRTVLEKHLPPNQNINFLSLDVEGFELEVLESNNWLQYRPEVVLVESLELKTKKKLIDFFNTINYTLIAQTVNNLYFTDNQSH